MEGYVTEEKKCETEVRRKDCRETEKVKDGKEQRERCRAGKAYTIILWA